ncbi:Alpha-D-ribose 1-methylphosphonate 5-triphosphate synthase subunit PhnH [Pseudoruegeria aquimaris]|uniref:Alpha-D-ribose 1-methylphosphonate 5-triphosphate synthase subunit PhnH n=1 Tax=Pseudoruegeria aquimaris TaxID=393663 RepID=A0A1Y5RMC8_9RHOB|nr:phosphonate C-P lyase system protein PhnH [Pseudoruegeria aquimaris]MBC7133937.1 phosphonate C-P lyase system protein PhnH [Roseovarius sp.]SLN20503.1 Alpha-D-ribose 1-methylphosphonate 5-triphosphate synthase subunit PhnH [Pseudoruegeria aquimaris]
MHSEALSGGFADPPIQSAQAFRKVMEAMARPGTIHEISGAEPPVPLSQAAGSVLLTLCDGDTPIHLAGGHDTEAIRDWLAFHTGAPLAAASECMFALGRWEALKPLSAYPLGTPEYPDRSATLIVECDELAAEGVELSGPGIEARAALSLPEVAAFRANNALFPLGLDFIFTCGSRLAALPRTTRIHAPEAC